MAKELDSLTIGYDKLSERGKVILVGSSGKIIATVTAIVAALVTFTDIAFSSVTCAEFTSAMIVTLIASYLIYFSLEDAGERLGEGSTEYLNAEKYYNEIRERIKPNHIPKLRGYCVEYARDELDFRRKAYLCSFGYTPEDYERYLNGEKFTARSKRLFQTAERMKPMLLTPSLLLSGEENGRASELHNPNLIKIFDAAIRLIPSTLCMLFTTSVILTAKPDLSPTVIIEGILKLSALPIVGFRGYVSGYKFSKNTKTVWLETKARILEGFISDQIS